MYVDAITLAAIADEWRILLPGARIDTIIAPSEYALALQCYAPGAQGEGGRNRWIYLSAHPQLARAHITALKPPRIASEPSAFVMLLRKHLEGARIEAIAQPRWERVIEIIAGYRGNPESNERTTFRLIIEIMGRLSNIILCDESNMILGSLKRVGAEVNRYRTIAANIPYVPPPPQQRTIAGQLLPKLDPATITTADLFQAALEDKTEPVSEKKRKTGIDTKLSQLLTKHVLGFSSLLAREVVYRTTGNSEATLTMLENGQEIQKMWEELAWNVRDIARQYDAHQWQPQLVERIETQADTENSSTSSSGVPIAFAPYVLEQYSELPDVEIRSSPSMNVLLDDYFARTEWRDAMESVRAPLRKLLQTQRDRCKRKAVLLQQELVALNEASQYRLHAELLLAHQHNVQQGQKSVTLENFFASENAEHIEMVTVPLDPRFDAVGNANRLFHKYHKLRRAVELVPDQIEQNAAELATLEQLLADLMLAETPAEVGLVKAEVQTAGYLRGGKQLAEKKAAKKGKGNKGNKGGKGKGKGVPPGGGVPLHITSHDGFGILVGKNSRQNEEVTFHQATANDMWLHARGVPGSHVIIKAAGRE
ncbi:MAG: NFACT family protein, partial [Chloroflexota bacterium]|nr:NFACT family protein [Chloroflexota bacterium]